MSLHRAPHRVASLDLSAEHRVAELSADLEELSAVLQQVRADLDAMTIARDTLQVFTDDCCRDLGNSIGDLLALREQHDAVAAERDRMRAQLARQRSEIEALQRLLRERAAAGEAEARP